MGSKMGKMSWKCIIRRWEKWRI